jgi:hypothetical protein
MATIGRIKEGAAVRGNLKPGPKRVTPASNYRVERLLDYQNWVCRYAVERIVVKSNTLSRVAPVQTFLIKAKSVSFTFHIKNSPGHGGLFDDAAAGYPGEAVQGQQVMARR